MQWLRSLVYTAWFMLWTGCYAVFFSLVGGLLPFRARFVLAQVWSRVLLTTLRWCCRLDYQVTGQENLPAGNHIALMKHSSSWEAFAQVALLPAQVWVLKRELMWVPALGWSLKLMRAIAVDRGAGGTAVRGVVEQGKRRLAEGEWVVIFPEGTRMPPGQTRRYGVSGALLAVETGKLIVPVAHDAGYYWPRRGLYKKPGTIRVTIGPPIQTAGRDPRDINIEAQNWIEAHSNPPD
jgi:1-acyl-sn-glycerol-3-phosphate acyltransferase